MTTAHLLIIDPQNDFMDQPNAALAVTGALQDMKRLASFITRMSSRLDDIHVTLDSHHVMDVAHPMFWRNDQNQAPNPFTIIKASDVEAKVWYPRVPSLYNRMKEYTKALEDGKRYPLCIWPEHCLIGTVGAAIQEDVQAALNDWARKGVQCVDFVTKGSNVYTEHYSAITAEVPDPTDPTTTLNWSLINTIAQADVIYVAGEALSHCVANTLRDLANNFGEENIKKIVLLTDCSSSVTGFEAQGEAFIQEMVARGMRTALSTDFN